MNASTNTLLDPAWIEQAKAKHEQRTEYARGRFTKPNPCVVKYGPSPTGGRCRDCKHLLTVKPGRRTFHKCPLRGPINDALRHYLAQSAWRDLQDEYLVVEGLAGQP